MGAIADRSHDPDGRSSCRRASQLGVARTGLSRHLEEAVYPALFVRLAEAFPEFAFEDRGECWVATSCPVGFPRPGEEVRPDRIMCYANSSFGFMIHGLDFLTWLTYLNRGVRPTGREFLAAARELCRRARVPVPGQAASGDGAILQAERWERRRAAVVAVLAHCRQRIRGDDPGAVAARLYLHGRGLDDAAIEALELGYYESADEVRRHLDAEGQDAEAAREAGLL
ncbi:MAG TPA: hypothetical protein VG406_15955, partial [Isosphaeraceae bacterium]|nr:hypothetical protein [Isosphaeraceae bacterium]